MFMKILVKVKKYLILVIIQLSQKYYDDSNKLSVSKMKPEMGGFAIEEFVGLKPNMYSFLVNDSTEHKKVKGINKSVVATINHGEYKDILLNNKCLRH